MVLKGPREYITLSGRLQRAVPGTGLAILVRKHVQAYTVAPNAPLSTLAIRANLQKEYTICNIYIEQDIKLQVNHLQKFDKDSFHDRTF